MARPVTVVFLMAVGASVVASAQRPDLCDYEYLLPQGAIPSTAALDTNAVNTILTASNRARRAVSPLATEMPMLRWDQTLAEYSQQYVSTCPGFVVSPYEERQDPERFGVWYVGQSIAAGPTETFGGPNGVKLAIQQMLSEQQYWTFPQTCAEGKECTRYTQIIWADTTRVGCGMATCGSTPTGPPATYLVCSYAVGGNLRGGEDLEIAADCSICSCVKPTSSSSSKESTVRDAKIKDN